MPSKYVLRSLLNGTLLSLSLKLFIEASFAKGIPSSSELSLTTSCKTQSLLVSESLLVAEFLVIIQELFWYFVIVVLQKEQPRSEKHLHFLLYNFCIC